MFLLDLQKDRVTYWLDNGFLILTYITSYRQSHVSMSCLLDSTERLSGPQSFVGEEMEGVGAGALGLYQMQPSDLLIFVIVRYLMLRLAAVLFCQTINFTHII